MVLPNKSQKITLTDEILMMMVKNLLEKVRTIQLLGELGRKESIAILTKVFLELNVSLRFIIKENADNHAKSYYYYNKIQGMKKLIKMQRNDSMI